MAKRKKKKPIPPPASPPPRLDRTVMQAFDSFEAADQADREYWWSRTPEVRLRECERLRQLNWGYGNGKPLPKLERILRIKKMGEPDPPVSTAIVAVLPVKAAKGDCRKHP